MALNPAAKVASILSALKARLPRKTGSAPDTAQPAPASGDAPKASQPIRQGAPGPRITLSGPLLLALSLVLICAVAWAFFMGLMVGRGQNPGDTLPAMARFLEESPSSHAEADPDPQPDTQGPSGVVPALPVPVPGVHAAPTGAATKAWPETEPAPRPRPKPVAKPTPAPANPRQLYDFVYQAAAFKNNVDASRVQKALTAKGLRASVRRSGKVYLLVINFRGTQAEADKAMGRLRSEGLGKPMQLARTPVETKTSPKKQSKK